ncbi:hypothetical protein GFY24_14870 [Nocardia sp. SYP-A9097]|uniref:DUF7373 family lipoprotein n=1 Tax=Nocardia sp. SYP-A9097 TaxID=2663237 RepID=UPI00129B34B8|nr:hypothetical protein [Nocardia sp. SYP-A9097]MRH88711.1 hypothetical protein [Nocardia sp. SYP-A9097]
MVRNSRRSLFAACVSLTALLLTACSVSGTPTAGELDVRTLAVGGYPVDRHTYSQDAGSNGALLEGFRMSEAVVPTVQIDSALVYGGGGRATVDAADATKIGLATSSQPVLERNHLITAFAASGADQPDGVNQSGGTSVTNMVMRFSDDKTAKTAARELEDADFGVAPDLNKKLPLGKYPDAFVHWRPGIATVGAFLPYKQYVISLFIERPKADEKDLLDWVRKTFDAQVPVLDKFTPTPESNLTALKVDPNNLLARAVIKERGSGTPDPKDFAVYGGTKIVHNANNQTKIGQAVTDSGADALATVGEAWLIRTRDDAGAQSLMAALLTDETDHYDSVGAPNDVPGAKCLQLNSKGDSNSEFKNRCYVSYKRYIGVVSSDDESDVRQKVAAQYALLANSL